MTTVLSRYVLSAKPRRRVRLPAPPTACRLFTGMLMRDKTPDRRHCKAPCNAMIAERGITAVAQCLLREPSTWPSMHAGTWDCGLPCSPYTAKFWDISSRCLHLHGGLSSSMWFDRCFHLLRNGMAPSSPTLMHLLPSWGQCQGLQTTVAAIVPHQAANCPRQNPMQAKLGSLLSHLLVTSLKNCLV